MRTQKKSGFGFGFWIFMGLWVWVLGFKPKPISETQIFLSSHEWKIKNILRGLKHFSFTDLLISQYISIFKMKIRWICFIDQDE
jgi:hypothetical protein